MLLVGGVGAGMVSWRYSSAAKLNDHMETQVYVRSPSLPPAVRRKGPRIATVGKRAGLTACRPCPSQGYPLRMEEEVQQLTKEQLELQKGLGEAHFVPESFREALQLFGGVYNEAAGYGPPPLKPLPRYHFDSFVPAMLASCD